MTDYFALLNQPRRPWLDPEEVRSSFLARSAEAHPDRFHQSSAQIKAAAQEQFADLNAACQCLRDPKERLRHLLELERGARTPQLQQLPPSTADFYFRLGESCREVDEFLRSRETVASGSPLLKVRSFEKAMGLREALEVLLASLKERSADLERELRELNVAWEQAPSSGTARAAALPLDRLEQIYRDLGFILRWSEQVRQRIVQLSV